ncbi:MAG: ABC transporter permease [Chloroflexi bacterium]|nr:ABC transporter permease [Chloroflexota bacterium]
MSGQKARSEFVYFALRNKKLRVGIAIILFFLLLALIGPLLAPNDPFAYINPRGAQPPSSQYWFGTTMFGQDVFAQFAHGLRATFLVGLVGGGLGTLIGVAVGFTAGYRGGAVDEVLNVLTNVVLVIPTLAILLIIAAYLKVRGLLIECIFIGCTAWPWTARAVRAQTFSLRSREFVDLARMSGRKSWQIVFGEIAPNMMSYLLLVFILQFGGAILIAATLDFIGLGPTNAISLGLMMQYAVLWGALLLGMWWWFVPPGLAITAIVGALYVTNVGLDEVFNPRLREM